MRKSNLTSFYFLSCSSNRHQRRVHENNRENSLGSSFRGRKRSTRSPSTTGEGSGGGVAGGAGSHAGGGDVQRRRDRRQRREAKPPVNYDHHQPATRRRSTRSSPQRQVGLSFSLYIKDFFLSVLKDPSLLGNVFFASPLLILLE